MLLPFFLQEFSASPKFRLTIIHETLSIHISYAWIIFDVRQIHNDVVKITEMVLKCQSNHWQDDSKQNESELHSHWHIHFLKDKLQTF